eukprot:7742750-Alexandrium_andersonii.AAC.1
MLGGGTRLTAPLVANWLAIRFGSGGKCLCFWELCGAAREASETYEATASNPPSDLRAQRAL